MARARTAHGTAMAAVVVGGSGERGSGGRGSGGRGTGELGEGVQQSSQLLLSPLLPLLLMFAQASEPVSLCPSCGQHGLRST